MSEKIKLPVARAWRFTLNEYVLVDADGKRVCLQDAADAINATARRCDGCAHFNRTIAENAVSARRWCALQKGWRDADDCCRKGWEAR